MSALMFFCHFCSVLQCYWESTSHLWSQRKLNYVLLVHVALTYHTPSYCVGSQEVEHTEEEAEPNLTEEHINEHDDSEKCHQELDEFHSDQDHPTEGLDGVDGGDTNPLEDTEIPGTHPDLD